MGGCRDQGSLSCSPPAHTPSDTTGGSTVFWHCMLAILHSITTSPERRLSVLGPETLPSKTLGRGYVDGDENMRVIVDTVGVLTHIPIDLPL